MNFDALVTGIMQTHVTLQQSTASAINRHLTIRNRLIGFYIIHFEQRGEDRAKYGDELVKNLTRKINIRGLSATNLKLFRQFYLCYPQIVQSAIAQLRQLQIGQTVSDQLQNIESKLITTQREELTQKQSVNGDKLLTKLSFSHILELIQVKDNLKRAFYELECIKGNWSVRELSRQIDNLYYERSAMSQKPEKLSATIAGKAETVLPEDVIKPVYTFEFPGLRPKEVVEESKLETFINAELKKL